MNLYVYTKYIEFTCLGFSKTSCRSLNGEFFQNILSPPPLAFLPPRTNFQIRYEKFVITFSGYFELRKGQLIFCFKQRIE